ncbi:MAG TPA: hypothetical protein VGH43_17705 [Jatrophihabitans sp.]
MGAAGSASAAPGAGTWSRITTPAHDVVYKFNSNPSATNPMPVSGTASLDVTSVDIDCVFTNGALRQVRTFASAVPVTAGHFSTTANVPSPTAQCRLRAIPTGVNTDTDYLGAFAGPLFFMYTVGVLKDATTPVGYLAVDEEADGLAQALNADQCGIIVLATVDRPSMEVRGSPLVGGCAFALPSANLAGNGSAIKVDGHNAYLPYGVSSYLRGSLALTLAQSKLTVTWHRASNGDMTVTESAPLMRCSGGDTYPPTSTSCPSLVNTRVTFRRVLSLFRGGHQARVRDTFTSTSGKHTVRTEYQGRVEQPKYGEPGYRFPGHGAAFHTASPSQVVSGLGAHAASMTVRTDVHAVDSDPQDDTYAYSWSRAPQSVRFSSSSPLRFAMPYTLTVPAGKAAYIGFAESEHVAVGDATKLANVALGEMVNPPTFSSPANGATITGKSVTVKGAVTLGANGLPRSVTVNGHAAKLSIVSATKETYAVTFTEALGKHTITATAKDTAGNTKTRSIKITNR